MSKFSIDNYKHPTPARFRKIGDLCLVVMPVIQSGIMSAPDLGDSAKYWLMLAVSVVMVTAKFITNMFKDDQE